MDRRRAGLVGALCLGLLGCTWEGAAPVSAPAAGSTAGSPTAPITVAGCDAQQAGPLEPLEPFVVPATGGTVTVLAFGAIPAQVGDRLKIVWRVTGEGELQVRPVRPDGTPGELGFGPEPHGGSNFAAPGDEWGTSVVLDAPGCWEVRVERGDVVAGLPLLVEPAPG